MISPRSAIQAIHELGPSSLAWFAWYQVKLRTGIVRRQTQFKPESHPDSLALSRDWFRLPEISTSKEILGEAWQARAFLEADEILEGKVRLFGGQPVELKLHPPGTLQHWTQLSDAGEQDIKLIWEPGRLGWACTLARAYFFSQDERYALAFWRLVETFLDANPPYNGPHWLSSQEVALRMIALSFSWQIIARSSSSTPERERRLAQAIVYHARRIPPTLAYARAQNNNHLLVEACGLYTAATLIPGHPSASHWKRLGWQWLNWALQHQVNPDGTYIQQSCNYHRLMLQAALWIRKLATTQGQSFPPQTGQRLAAAARWIGQISDPVSGCVPNLGPNDGAYILPLSSLPFQDYRPVVQAAMQAFTGERPLPAGPWDEMGMWLLPDANDSPPAFPLEAHPPEKTIPGASPTAEPYILQSKNSQSWSYFRVTRFSSRPGHADQLHLDIWWRGLNIAGDAGTFLYNAPAPWQNALTHTAVHNTLMVNDQEQMQRISRFLYLGWAQARLISDQSDQEGMHTGLVAQHDGYCRFGLTHRRSVEACPGGWIIRDTLLPDSHRKSISPIQARLHWLLPDTEWNLAEDGETICIRLRFPQGKVNLRMKSLPSLERKDNLEKAHFSIVRAGNLVHGTGSVQPSWGWTSPTYGYKIPALSLAFQVQDQPPFTIISEWTFLTE